MSVPDLSIQQLAWHDAICPEARECRDRSLHAMSAQTVNSGILTRYHEALDALSAAPPESEPCQDARENPRAHGPHGLCPGLAVHPDTILGGGGARRRPVPSSAEEPLRPPPDSEGLPSVLAVEVSTPTILGT